MAQYKFGDAFGSLPGAGNLHTDDAVFNRVLVVDSNGRVAQSSAATDPIVGVGSEPAVNSSVGTAVGFSVRGRVRVIAGDATAISPGDSLAPAANGTVVNKSGNDEGSDRLIALEASSAAGTVFDAWLT